MKKRQQLPQGVSDLYSQDYEMKQIVIEKILKLTKTFGFKQIQTPTFEYYDLFVNMPGTMDTDQMIKMVDHDGKILVLRPDATIPIARMVANAPDEETRLKKLSYVTNIFRMQNGESDVSSRSFTQVGVERFGDADLFTDVEIISLAIEALKKVGVSQFQIDLGQASFYKSLIEETNLTLEQRLLIQEKIEQKNEFELQKVLEAVQLSTEKKEVLLQLPRLFGRSDEVIKKAKLLVLNEKMKKAVDELEWVVEQLKALQLEGYISVDLGLINHLNYYTGIMFQGYIHEYGKPVIQGGRYDELTEQFGLQFNAIGFGIYIDQLIEALNNKKISFQTDERKLLLYGGSQLIEALKAANELREKDFIVDVVFQRNSSTQGDFFIDLEKKLWKDLKSGSTQAFTHIEDLLQKVGVYDGNR